MTRGAAIHFFNRRSHNFYLIQSTIQTSPFFCFEMRIQKGRQYRDSSPFRRSYSSRSHYHTIPARKSRKESKTFSNTTLMTKKFQSRVVTVVSPKRKMGKDRHGNNHVRHRYSNLKKPYFEFASKRPKLSLMSCPNAPHNTTSYLMNFHRDDILNKFELDRSWTSDEDDDSDSDLPLCHAYGSFFGSVGDSYEVSSQFSAPQ